MHAKARRYFYNGMSADGFDSVINPIVTEPVVQFTLYLKLKSTSSSRSLALVRSIAVRPAPGNCESQ